MQSGKEKDKEVGELKGRCALNQLEGEGQGGSERCVSSVDNGAK